MRKLFVNVNASAAIEFALVAPVLFLLIFGIIETSFIMLLQGNMEYAVRQASRSGITGYTPTGMTRAAYIQSQVNQNLIFPNTANVTLTTLIYPSFEDIHQAEPYTDTNHNGKYDLGEPYTDINGNGQWDADMGVSGDGGAGDIVVYTVTYNWTILTPFLSHFFSSNGQLPVSASMVVRNEPYAN